MSAIPVIVIVGPTAVGKTALSIAVAEKFSGEIISGDSMQVYKGLDIGTAKVTTEEMHTIPHYLIDEVEPQTPFTAAKFQKATKQYIHQIAGRANLPIIVGGTGLYIQSVFYDYNFGTIAEDRTYRKELEKLDNDVLWEQLKALDSLSAERIHANNKQRVIRALEVIKATNKPFSAMHTHKEPVADFRPLYIGLDLPREQLYARINVRVELMLQAGLVEEARNLYEQGLDKNLPAMKGIGYKELFAFFEGDISLEAATDQIKQNSRRFAKRQLTWFRNRMDIHWLEADSQMLNNTAEQLITDFLKK
ncbi:tRNA dimethylallyltransferase [Listeria grayi]|uniref:tRNA dimethylallyltransferase n=1 Tax=Listeria grayi FSL F6-1183 TaxID=1265827 RepID=A0A829R7V6_LISGR|nr:tRNA (adenosine(37)-N6)-dimethylallyltransferase MiaA [Listeria grayi]EUJ27835.1 tRNA delta(2)-isopentenylpyrophosphate transferase [Listeria grayi FSL F6-1183]VEI34642.1 tRNA dimethylallyltransferase [Listeria grayi]